MTLYSTRDFYNRQTTTAANRAAVLKNSIFQNRCKYEHETWCEGRIGRTKQLSLFDLRAVDHRSKVILIFKTEILGKSGQVLELIRVYRIFESRLNYTNIGRRLLLIVINSCM